MATPTSNSTTVTYNLPTSSNNEIDSLLGGEKWGGGLGAGVTLSYSFPSGTTSFATNYGSDNDASEWNAGWYALNTTQQVAFESALLTLSNVANMAFVEFSDNSTTVGEIRVAMSENIDDRNIGGSAYYPSSGPAAGDVWLSPDAFLSDPITVGTWEFNALIHELGHAVGLSHPHDGGSSSGSTLPDGVNGTDNIFYTVMSYTKDPSGNKYHIDRYPETPMILDIQALQYIYGVNTTHNAGDTTYTYTDNEKYFETIWDAGGTDKIDYRSSTTGATIDLREGAWSSLGRPIVFTKNGVQRDTDPRTVWIAYGAEIENASGSQGDDLIYGNSLNNELYGHWGADTLYGFGGDDRFVIGLDEAATSALHAGSPGVTGTGESLDLAGKWLSLDTYHGGSGSDTLWGSDVYNDVIFLDNSSGSPLLDSIETIRTRGGDDVVDLTSNSFSYGNIKVYGGDGNDIIWSNAGDDFLYGDAGNDTILGWDGEDAIVGGAGNDTLFGGRGNDWLRGGSGDDYLDGGEGNQDAVYADFLPSQYSLKGNILSGPEGDDTLVGIELIYLDFYIGDSRLWTYIDLNDFIDPDGLEGDGVSQVTERLNGITDLYVAYFNRAPDPDGLRYWFVEINDGTLSLENTATSFTDQQEYRETYPESLGNREFIQRIYQNLFDREPDQAGWDYWENDLNNGLPRDTFILTIINGAYDGPSAVDKSLLNNKHDASMYYSEQLTLNPEEGFDENISEVLNNVTADGGTVVSAMEVIDYAMDNAITITGIVENQGLWDSMWA